MAGASKTGLNGIPRDPRGDARSRRARGRLGQTDWLVPPSGIIINSNGQIDLNLDTSTGGWLANAATGLGVPQAGPLAMMVAWNNC